MPALDLRALLVAEGFDPTSTLIFRHRPREPRLRSVFAWLAADDRRLFERYQSSHDIRAEAALLRATHLVSCIGDHPGRAVFVGVYDQAGSRPLTRAEGIADPAYQRLVELGMTPWGETEREVLLRFDLRPNPAMADWSGRLVLQWPPPDRSWYRWADPRRNTFPMRAVAEQSLLVAPLRHWSELVLGYAELGALPRDWATALRQWRGVYLVFDTSDGRSYVGSAYGRENLLGRWLAYASTGHGGNVMLRDRDPQGFRFSILQLVAHDMPADDVLSLEASWKTRLHTREFGLNAN